MPHNQLATPPSSPSDWPEEMLFRKRDRFMDLPFSRPDTVPGAAILGCPFDCGINPFRIGSRQGPESIREQSRLIRPLHPELADYLFLDRLGAVDAGDVVLTPSRIEDAFARIEEAAFRLASSGTAPIGLGGDGTISLPLIRAASRVHPDLAVLHIDSHTDAHPVDPADPFSTATQFTHVALEQRISPSHSYHIGLRGTNSFPGMLDYARDELGYQLITLQEYLDRGPADVMAELHQRLGARPIYLSWDMDVFDPSCAPGVCSPVWGGYSAREGHGLLRGLAGLNIVAADINTVSPPHDVNGMAGFLAGATAFEILLLIWMARSGADNNNPKAD